jgi:hypothetical protein
VKVTGDPLILTQIVKGSLPIFSVVKPCVLETEPGTVTGIVVLHEFALPAVTLMLVMVLPAGLSWYVMLGAQASRAIRAAKPVDICER